MLVKKWMTEEVITVESESSMQDAINVLKESGHNTLPVIEKDRLVGVISDRDLKKASPSDATSLDIHELMYLLSKIKIKDLMEKNVITISPDQSIEEAATLMLENKISGLPVVEERDKLVGIITRSDIFRIVISLTGREKRGIQIAVRLLNQPGTIKDIREIIRNYNGNTVSILTSEEGASEGSLNVYFRATGIEREKLPAIVREIEDKGEMLYIIDHRDQKRTFYEL